MDTSRKPGYLVIQAGGRDGRGKQPRNTGAPLSTCVTPLSEIGADGENEMLARVIGRRPAWQNGSSAVMFSWLFSDPLPAGTPAPDFSLPDDEGRTVTLSALRGKPVVLVFYPGDDTPGCTKQLCAFRDDWDEVRRRGIELFGVNPQSPTSHGKFRQKYHFPFPLLVDRGQKVGALYHTNGLIVKRTVYLIGRDGVIRFARRGMPKPAEVLAAGS